MTLDIIKLHFKTPLHLSKGKLSTYEDSEEMLHSDTLKSAIFAAAMMLPGEGFDEETFFRGFTVSSAFPFYGDELFFPKPALAASLTYSEAKDLKKVKWLGKSIFQKVLKGEQVALAKDQFAFDGEAVSDQLSKEERKGSFYEKEKTQRVRIPRIWEEADSTPFYLDKLYFHHGKTGLYFIVHWRDESHRKRFHHALRLLGDNGIGLQRNLGNGSFEYQPQSLDLELPTASEAVVNLSLYCPKWSEWEGLDLECCAYRFVKRGGWISSTAELQYLNYRKRSVHMLSEGSVFPFGQLTTLTAKGNEQIDLTPDIIKKRSAEDKVWRDGTGLFLPMASVKEPLQA